MIVELAFPSTRRRGKKEPVGNPVTLTHIESPTTKLVFSVVQPGAKVAIVSPTGGAGNSTGLNAFLETGCRRSANLIVCGDAGAAFCATFEDPLAFAFPEREADDDE